ncbi:MAG TPA: M15 family metallopeptidase [Fimbriimonadaceae bacterium]|nr:M15 family metallopeptidase [Fimbriimonadaceae bacterium]
MPSSLTDLVPVPLAASINTGKHPCQTGELVHLFGLPCNPLPHTPKGLDAITNAKWRTRMVTQDVGPFRVTGHVLAVKLLRTSLTDVKARKPELHAALGTAGMLAVRAVNIRGHYIDGRPSNHAFGLAVDFTIAGKLDVQGDGKVMAGLLDLYSVMKDHGWFWGAEFGVEDAMHFEVSWEIVRGWLAARTF